MGLISFSPEAKKQGSSRWVVVVAIALGLPIVLAAAVVSKIAAPVFGGTTLAALRGPSAVTMATVLVTYWTSIQVSIGRGKYKVKAPATIGVNEDFDRIFRVHANTIEQLVMFIPALWMFSLYVSPLAGTIGGAVWIAGRVMYANGYYKSAATRGPGFGVASLASNFLITGAVFGVARSIIAA